MATSKQKQGQVVFGSSYGKSQSKADAQIMREIQRIEKQHIAQGRSTAAQLEKPVASVTVKAKGVKTLPSVNGASFHSNGSNYHRYP